VLFYCDGLDFGFWKVVLMPLNNPLDWTPDLEKAIDRYPLMVPPTTSLIEAIALLGTPPYRKQTKTNELEFKPVEKDVRISCVLVTQGQELLGILTERDIVRLTAQKIDFASVTVADVMIHPIITLSQRSVQDIFAVLFLFRRYNIRHLPIVDNQEKLIGIVTHESIRKILRPANLLRFRRVADVMTNQVVQAPLTVNVLELAQLMSEHRVSCVVITQRNTENNQNPVGIVTERDIVQLQALQIDLINMPAEMVMSTPLFLLSPEDSLWTAHQEMQTRKVGRLVVSWNWGQNLGIVTQTSLLRVFDPMEMYGVIENLQQTIQQLMAEQVQRNPPSSTDLISPELDFSLFLSLVENNNEKVKSMLTNENLPVDQRQKIFHSIIKQLEQINQDCNVSFVADT
jgi:CBS domain-containing protein